MKNENLFRIRDIISIVIFLCFLFFTVYIAYVLPDEKLGLARMLLDLALLISMFFTFLFAIGLLRHFIKFSKKSKVFYFLQFFVSLLFSLIIFSILLLTDSRVSMPSQEDTLAMGKSELEPIVLSIEKYQKEHHILPENLKIDSIKAHIIHNIYYFTAPNSFILGTHVSTIDLDGAQVFYDSRSKSWNYFHNDMYQYAQDKKEKPKSIERYISFQKQANITRFILKKSNGLWLTKKEETEKKKQEHLLQYKKSCNEGHGASCTAVGMRYAMGLDIEWSNVMALEYFSKACDLNDGNGCEYLARIYARGKGIKKDISKSEVLYKKACNFGAKSACSFTQQ